MQPVHTYLLLLISLYRNYLSAFAKTTLFVLLETGVCMFENRSSTVSLTLSSFPQR